jgi:Leucine-rich repeat (LRR) protein
MKLDKSHRHLTTLDGIDLTCVTELDCSFNDLTSLPELPATLLTLICCWNKLTNFSLPDTLKYLDCSGNNFQNGLPKLPKSLRVLHCNNSHLSFLPETLPESLKKLFCYENNLTSLPKLPLKLITLECDMNKLTNLPELPNTLEDLACFHNNIQTYPKLPENLKEFHCDHTIDLFDLPFSLTDTVDGNPRIIKLNQHNKKRVVLGMPKLKFLPDRTTWDEVNEKYTIWTYSPGGDKYKEAEDKISQLG